MKRMSFVIFMVMGVFLGSLALAQEKVVVKVWDQFEYEGTTAAGPAMDKLVERYEQLNPNVKIERTVVSQTKIRDQIRLARSAGTAPDVVYTWPAAAVLAGYARDGMLYDLTEDAKALGWFEKLPDLEIKRCSYQGRLYAYPSEQDLMLVYYNKDLFNKFGLQEPSTYEEFLKICETLKAQGYIPIAFGNRDKWPATNVLSYLLTLIAGKQKQEEVFFGDLPWQNKDYVEACQVFLDWADKGFFPDGFNGIDYGEANTLFGAGKAAMNVTGTWIIQDMAGIKDFTVDVFFLPQIKASLPQATMTGEGSQWEINAKSDPIVKKEAVKFLDFLYSEESVKVWIEEGYLIPIVKGGIDLSNYDVPDIVKKAYRIGNQWEEYNGYDLHTTVPESVVETLYNELQSMLGGVISPQDFLKKMDDVWQRAKEANEIWKP